MRSSILVSAAFALGALAAPHKRDDGYVVTETDVVEETVTVYVTATGLPPVSVSEAAITYSPAAKHYSHSHYHYHPSSSSPVPVESSVEPSVYVAPSSSAPAYTPPVSSAPVYTPEPSSTPVPVSSAVYSSAAPVSSAASYGGSIGPAHVTGDAQADITSGDDYKNMILFHHNLHRANHSADPLTWDDSLASAAAEGAKCSNWPFHHTSAGQNMAASGPIANVSAGITDGWYNGEMPNYAPYYDVAQPDGDFEGYGHFTQLVWKGTQRVGCVTTNCVSETPGMWITVCNYMPMGNVDKAYGDNVGKPLGAAIGSWTN